ncbi:MAG: hypothetical protein JO332_07220 [Planctomycetaceae bacterium]|nr:hypothetical protein [Planctomycetaceae bacterium]
MLILTLLALLAPPDADQKARDFFDRIEFEAPSPDSDEGRRVAEILLKKEHWIGAFKTLERRLGDMPENLSLKVDFTLEGQEAGWGGSNGVQGKVRFNLKVLTETQKRIDEIERKRKEGAARGERIVYLVPPLRMERLIYHELTHVFQRSCDAPLWFNEGMAQLIADDPNNLAAFANARKKVAGIEEESLDRNDTYARGHSFWKWLDSKGAVKKTADLVVFQRRPWREALEEATGFPWVVLSIAERDWSAKEVEKLQSKEKGR